MKHGAQTRSAHVRRDDLVSFVWLLVFIRRSADGGGFELRHIARGVGHDGSNRRGLSRKTHLKDEL
jgi:hypothetical protein